MDTSAYCGSCSSAWLRSACTSASILRLGGLEQGQHAAGSNVERRWINRRLDVRVFEIGTQGVRELPSTATAVAAFKACHSCEARGNNTQAYTWIGKDELVLVTSVYPTGDCGPDLGHLEAYVVKASTGTILRHMDLGAFKRFAKNHPE